jgi:hypothetical protein
MGPKRVTVRDGRAPRSSDRGEREQKAATHGLKSQQGALPELIDRERAGTPSVRERSSCPAAGT